MSRKLRFLPYLIVLGVAAWLYQGVTDYAHLGRDTWPLIATARIQSLSDLFGIFTKELMHGIYPDGSFYRPLTSLSYALDHALYGEEPRGYHITDLSLFGLMLCGGLALALRHAKRKWELVAVTVCGVLFVLHPVVRDVVPLTARRADLLVLGSTLWALRLSLNPKGHPHLAAVLCLAACASKETGFSSCVLVLGAAWASGKEWREAIRFAAPSLILTALFFAARAAVLSGLGGHVDGLSSPGQIPAAFAKTFLSAWAPGSPLFPEKLRIPAACLLGLSTLEALRHGRERRWSLVLFTATLLSVALPALGGRAESWYVLFPAAFVALLLGHLASAATQGAPLRTALPLVLWAPALVLGSPFFEREDIWLRASTRAERFEEVLDSTLDAVAAGQRAQVVMPRVFFSAGPNAKAPRRSVPLYAIYSLVGREQLRQRSAPVRFVLEEDFDEDSPGAEDVIQIVLRPQAILIKD